MAKRESRKSKRDLCDECVIRPVDMYSPTLRWYDGDNGEVTVKCCTLACMQRFVEDMDVSAR